MIIACEILSFELTTIMTMLQSFNNLYLLVVCAIVILQDLDDTGLLTGFQGLVEKPNVAENVISLFNKVLDNKYSTSEGIKVHELLTWNLWPVIIKIFGESCIQILCYITVSYIYRQTIRVL